MAPAAPLSPPADSDSPAWARSALPWLWSAATHVALMLLLAVSVDFSSGAANMRSATTGIALNATVSATRSPWENENANSGVEIHQPAGANEGYFDDEVDAPDQGGEQTADGANPLGAVLSEEPPSLAGVLPRAGTPLGSHGLESGGIGAAGGLTKHSRPSNRLEGGKAVTGVYGVTGQGHKFVYVFDRSASMEGHGGAPLRSAKAELLGSLKDLGGTHQFQIIFYNEHPRVFNLSGSPGRLVFGNEQNKSLAANFVNGITGDGGTQHEEPLLLALRMAPDVIFFLTDADEPRMSQRQLDHIAHMNKGASINCVEFGFGPQLDRENFLVQLARQNGGKHVYLDVSTLSGQ